MSDSDDTLIVQKPLASTLSWWQKRSFMIGVALLGLLLVIITMTVNIAKYETHLATGKTVLLALAPVDPRGFMQGDYMTLSYALEGDIFDALKPEYDDLEAEFEGLESEIDPMATEIDESEQEVEPELNTVEEDQSNSGFRIYDPMQGYVIVKIDKNNVGQFARLADSNKPDDLAKNEMSIYYRARNGNIKLATNAFFFQEGQAESFEAAEYGLFRVNDKGEPLLTDMVDENFETIKGVNSDGIENLERLNDMGRQGSGM